MAKAERSTTSARTQFDYRRPHPAVKLVHTLRYHDGWIGRIAWSRTGVLASPSDDETVRLWNAEKGEHLATLRGHTSTVIAAAFNDAGSLLATASDDETVKLWDGSGELIRTLEGFNSPVKCVAFCPNEDAIAAGCADLVKVYRTSGQILRVNGGHTDRIWDIAFDSLRGIQITAGADAFVKLREAKTGNLLRRLEGHTKVITSVAFNAPYSVIASGSEDQTIRLWDISTGRLIRALAGHTGMVTDVTFSPDGTILASRGGDRDETIRLWSIPSGVNLVTIHVPTSTFIPPGLAFHPTKPFLAAVGSDIGTHPDQVDSRYTIRDRAVHVWSINSSRLALSSKAKGKPNKSKSESLSPALRSESPIKPIRLLHLSDLHFVGGSSVDERLGWLLNDIRDSDDLRFQSLDYLVVSGDFTQAGEEAGFTNALTFLEGLKQELHIEPDKCLIVPGNHDIVNSLDAYKRRRDASGLKAGQWIKQGDVILAVDPTESMMRFEYFSTELYEKLSNARYPIQYGEQGEVKTFPEEGIQLLGFNSAWEIDEFHRQRSSVNPAALAMTIKVSRKQEAEARYKGRLAEGKRLVKIAAIHHGPACFERDGDIFLEHIQGARVTILLHGHIHQHNRDLRFYWEDKNVHIIGGGSFGAINRPESTPRLYNLLEFPPNFTTVRVHTREQKKPNGRWSGYYAWPSPKPGDTSRVAYYDLRLT